MFNIEHGMDANGSTLRAMQATLEESGIEFDADGGGVRLKLDRPGGQDRPRMTYGYFTTFNQSGICLWRWEADFAVNSVPDPEAGKLGIDGACL